MHIERLVDEIAALPETWHGAGTVSASLLRALARRGKRMRIESSVETGSGRTTLLLSHLSERHTVFALDAAGSVSAVRASPLLRPGVVTFVEGATQVTLPRHRFEAPLDLVLLDGPHGYPFPELEYWHLYPHLRAGGLLLLDDIHIPTIHHLFSVLREDAMFSLLEIAGRTAIFERTSAPTFDPLGDGWERQEFNRRRFPVSAGLALVERAKLLVPMRVAQRLIGLRDRLSRR